jgi:mercuric ion binding protein
MNLINTPTQSLRTFALAALVLLAGFAPTLAEARSLRIEVNGLVCAFCADGITRAFRKEAAVGSVFVSLEDRLVAIDLKEGQDIADADVTRTLTDAGYTVVGIQRSDATVAEIKTELGRE